MSAASPKWQDAPVLIAQVGFVQKPLPAFDGTTEHCSGQSKPESLVATEQRDLHAVSIKPELRRFIDPHHFTHVVTPFGPMGSKNLFCTVGNALSYLTAHLPKIVTMLTVVSARITALPVRQSTNGLVSQLDQERTQRRQNDRRCGCDGNPRHDSTGRFA